MEHRNLDEELQERIEKGDIDPEEIHQDEPKWISYVTGLRGDNVFDCKTNVEDLSVIDYAESLSLLEFNTLVSIFREIEDPDQALNVATQYAQIKEIYLINYIRLLGDNLDEHQFSEDKYQKLKDMFNLDQIDQMLQERKEEQSSEILNNGNEEE